MGWKASVKSEGFNNEAKYLTSFKRKYCKKFHELSWESEQYQSMTYNPYGAI
jgi:hypothetical protein